MADNKLNYQQARRIRKSKFSDMVLDQLADKDTGVLGAIGKTISLRSQARMKGIKEKFDPLNIVKFMTMGSRFGPALFGKLTGRSQKDIDYFTGRTKSVIGGRNTADKLKKGGDGDSEGINEQLSKIFSFLKSSREEDVKLRELAKNSEEEIALEKARRHKEMIDTLEKLMKNINSGGQVVATAEPEKKSSLLEDLWDKLKGLADIVSLMKDTLVEIAKKIGATVGRALATAGQWALGAAEAAVTSGAATVGGVLAVGGLLTYGATNVLNNMSDEQLAEMSKSGGEGSLEAGILLSGRKSPEEVELAKLKEAKVEELMKDASWFTRTYGSKRDYLLNEKKMSKKDVDYLLGPSLDEEPEPTANPVPKDFGKLINPYETTGQYQTKPPIQNENLRPTMQNDPRLNQVSQPFSGPVSSLTNSNIDLSLPTSSGGVDMKTVVNKTVNNLSQKQERTGLRPSQIAVRNDEPTFMQLIVDSTRVV